MADQGLVLLGSLVVLSVLSVLLLFPWGKNRDWVVALLGWLFLGSGAALLWATIEMLAISG